ncbi:erythrocyte membrane protein 1, PfEMP1, putative [Plasmodium gaboni]|uniref:Erythrocyte membrane protein 1, PfEMP1, putative n=1 Tax=Plasmodium gaboni TaxID=647221 RepID=A0ABY0KW88_9APIC|nr:erythrocyte membrane protein 1, PfEMP1, putative [Plasmodium gaboni]
MATTTTNCGGTKSGVTTAQQIASMLQEEVKSQVDNDSGNVDHDGNSNLKAELKKALYGSGSGTSLGVEKPCDLKKETHTNATNGDPCKDKDANNHKMFKIGERWQPDNDNVNANHTGVLFPPRRLGMCTSNLEKLNTNAPGFIAHTFSSHSLLVDVLLTAKEEANKIIEQYKQHNGGQSKTLDDKDKECICRALKYSFADLGDIIRGRDIWNGEKNTEMNNLQTHLKAIFEKIKQNVNQGVTTYNNDTQEHTKLRNHWWEANRKSVWDAMLCAKDGSTNTSPCDTSGSRATAGAGGQPGAARNAAAAKAAARARDSLRRGKSRSRRAALSSGPLPPPDDYIPQRLRWLTEWAEWYCKRQSQVYNDLVGACNGCKTKNGNCEDQCTKCKEECAKYKKFIDDWEKDWDEQKNQYNTYYNQAISSKDGDGKDENEKYLYKFLYELHEKNKDPKNSNSVYGSAGGYIQREGHRDACVQQKEFCDNTSGTYAFKERPPVYEKACKCTPPQKPITISCSDNKILDTATYKHHIASQGLNDRGGDSLVGKLENATFKDGKKLNDGENACSLDKMQHTNDVRNEDQRKGGPCEGKGTNRFDIGKPWEKKEDEVNPKHKDVLLPPRRLDMCTSNLENLAKQGESPDFLTRNNVNDSFLGDVLLAAKEEGNFISRTLSGSAICTAMKYSFADLGDIIRGKDMWSNEKGMADLEKHLQAIFKKIKSEVDPKGEKYPNSGSDAITKLRSDWWSANRDKVWDAMTTCNTTITCDGGTTPLDDYIPQELRWIDEWSHTYCNQRKKYADDVKDKCQKCKDASDTYHEKSDVNYKDGGSAGGKTNDGSAKNCDSTNGSGNNSGDTDCEKCKDACDDCQKACEEYKKFVQDTSKNNWRKQWNDMEKKYNELMKNAKTKLEEYHKEQQQTKKTSQSPSGSSTPPYMTPCGSDLCVKNDINSFFQYMADKGITTLSSYISSVTTDCGGDKHVVATNACGITYI